MSADSSTAHLTPQSLPPLQDISEMAGFELPEYLGKVKGKGNEAMLEKGVEAEQKENNPSKKDKPKPPIEN